MKNSVVLVPFPFDDLSAAKVRPALCLTDVIKPYDHIVVAFITSNVLRSASTDLLILDSDPDSSATGLKVSSTVRVHRLMTISKAVVRRRLGSLSKKQIVAVGEKLRSVFEL